MKGLAFLHMRCLHCGKRLSLLRKFSDGEFCSTEHRALFDRLNNDLGLQRLIASQSAKERDKPELPKKAVNQPARLQPGEMPAPPLGRLVPGPGNKPIVLRQVNQSAVPPLLGPKEAAVPQPRLRASFRGLAEQGRIPAEAHTPAPMAAAGSPAVAPPIELDALSARADSLGLVDPPAASHEPQRIELLQSLETCLAAPPTQPVSAVQAGLCWSGNPFHAPALALNLMQSATASAPIEEPGSEDPGAGLDSLALLQALQSGPALPTTPPQALAPSLSVRFTASDPFRPKHTRWIAPPDFALLRTLGLATRGMALGFSARNASVPPRTSTWEMAKPRLRFKTEQVEQREFVPAEATLELRALALAVCAWSAPLRPVDAQPRLAAAPAQLHIGLKSSCAPLERELVLSGPRALALDSADTLLAWREPGTSPLSLEASPASLPLLALRPQVPTASEALETEVVALSPAGEDSPLVADPVPEAAPAGELPPLCDQQRRFAVLRPVERPTPAPACAASLGVSWRMSLEAAATCPRLKMKPDHADGSGSRSAQPGARSRTAMVRFRSVQERIPGGRFWRSAPADLKWIGLALPLILALVVWSFRGSVAPVEASLPQQPDPSKTVIAKQMHKFQQVLLSRAAIRLFDDFRGGLGSWNGKDASWAKTWKYTDASFLEPGELAIYSPTQDMQDYTMEFLGQIERRSLNWVFRAKDLNNYYAMRIVITRGGPLPSASIVRYAVVNGKESGLKTLPLPVAIRPDTVYRVRMDVRGSQFTTYVQGQVVDSFEDNRLPEGGIGFWSPRGDQSLLRWVEVMHQYDYLGRLCALLAPYPLQGGAQQAD